jgi:ABC-type dipeptide/oligopeptide/nickel transport system permease subunit
MALGIAVGLWLGIAVGLVVGLAVATTGLPLGLSTGLALGAPHPGLDTFHVTSPSSLSILTPSSFTIKALPAIFSAAAFVSSSPSNKLEYWPFVSTST